MKHLVELKETLAQNKQQLQHKFKVEQLGIFGSFVRGEQQKGSDLDILVEFGEPIGLFDFMELEEYLEKLRGTSIDLVSKKALKPHIGEYILKEVVYI